MKWISVEDSLPENSKAVLGCVTKAFSAKAKVSVSTIRYCGIYARWETLDYIAVERRLARVTYWMPLPEPPTGESDA